MGGFAAFLCYFMTVSDESLGFELLVGQKKQTEDVTLRSGKLVRSIFHNL